MIKKDQPTGLPSDMIVGLSSRSDGNMNYKDADEAEVLRNRQAFLDRLGIELPQTVLVCIDYNRPDNDYTRLAEIDPSELGVSMEKDYDTRVCDALATDRPGKAVFLPVGDCCPAILADRNGPAFMLAHLGRHNVEQNMGFEAVKFLAERYEVKPTDLSVWLGPAVGKSSYPLHAFDGRSLHEVIVEQLGNAGVGPDQIRISSVDTAVDENYYSHSEFKAGRRNENGRFAVVAMRSTPQAVKL